MKKLFLLAALALPFMASSQCDGNRYFNFVFDNFTESENIVYGSNINSSGSMQDLLLDVYTPNGDSETLRPLIIIVHGGTFIGGSKDEIDVVPLAEDFVKMGYVVASINYRLGIPLGLDIEFAATSAVVRGFHDGKAAIRFFRKDVAENGNQWGIDPDRIFMAGVSAGGFVALHDGYMDDVSEIPAVIDQSLPGLGGGIEGLSGNDGYSSALQGIVNIAGAIGDTSWMAPGDPPVLCLHGTQDGTVPYGSDMLQLFGAINVTEVDGSASVIERAEEQGITHCFEIYEGQDHVPHVSNAAYYDTTRSVMANFLGHLSCPDYELDCTYRELSVNIEESDLAASFRVFPNPSSGIVTIECPGWLGREFRVSDMYGRIIRQENITREIFTLDMSSLPSAYYLIQITGQDQQLVRRVMVE